MTQYISVTNITKNHQNKKGFKPKPVKTMKFFNDKIKSPKYTERYIHKDNPGFSEGLKITTKIGRNILSSELFKHENSINNEINNEEYHIKLNKLEETPISLETLCELNKLFIKRDLFGLFNHKGPVSLETQIIEKELKKLITNTTFTGDSQPFIHITYDNEKIIQKPYVLILVFDKSQQKLIERIVLINKNIQKYNKIHRFPINIINYDSKPFFCNQLITEQTYFTEIMFSTCSPLYLAHSKIWSEFFKSCITEWWTGIAKILTINDPDRSNNMK